MNKVGLIAAALSAAAAIALPSVASAAIWTTTYQGVVTQGSDIGTFGLGCMPCLGGGELNGLAFTATFVTDSSVAGASSLAGPHSLSLSGPGVVSAILTINGHSLALGGTSGSQALSDDGVTQTAAHSAGRYEDNTYYYDDPEMMNEPDYYGPLLYGSIFSASLSLSMSGPGDGNFNSLQPGMIGGGSFYQFLETNGGYIGASQDAGADLLITSYSSTYQGVPEPETWSMLIIGFGAAGAMLRRRRHQSLARA